MEEKLQFEFEYGRRARSMTEFGQHDEIARGAGYMAVPAGRARRAVHARPGRSSPRQPDAGGHRADGLGCPPNADALGRAGAEAGPQELNWILGRRGTGAPSARRQHHRTAAKRERLVAARKRRWRTAPYSEPLAHVNKTDPVRRADFESWLRTADG